MKFIYLVVVLCVIAHQEKCRALTMEGGGTKGAYEAGVISGLVYNLPPEERSWDVVSGISVGSIATLCLALFEKGDEIAAADFIQQKWLNIQMSNIIKNWPLSIAQGLFGESGLFDTSPEMEFITSYASDKAIKRHITIGMTDAQHGGEYIVSDKNFSRGIDFVKYVVGSSAIPAIFPDLKIGDDVFIDGLAVDNLDIISPINRCKELGFEEKDIVIDIILTNSRKNIESDISNDTSINAYLRSQSISSFLEEFYYIDQVTASHPKVDFRYLVYPTKKLPEYPGVPLNFNPKDLRTMLNMGIEDAMEAIKSRSPFNEKINRVY